MSNTPYLRVVTPVVDLGSALVGAPKSFSEILFNYHGSVTINSIAASNPDFAITSPAFPYVIPYIPPGWVSVILQGTVTPTVVGLNTCTFTITHTGIGDTTFVVKCTGYSTGPIVQIDPQIFGQGLGEAQPTKVGTGSNFGMFLTNPGDLPYTVTGAVFTGSGDFTLNPSSDAFPYTINPGDPHKSFFVDFNPTEVGIISGTVTFATDAPAPQDNVAVKLTGQGILLFPINVLTGIEQGLLFGANNASKIMNTDFNNPDVDSVLEFNGSLWNNLGFEKTLRRVEIYYRNVGACTGLVLTVKAFRPTLTLPPKEQTQSVTINIGDSTADDSERSQFFDCVLAGEIIIAQLKRTKNTGPCAIIAIVPEFEDKGPKVENK